MAPTIRSSLLLAAAVLTVGLGSGGSPAGPDCDDECGDASAGLAATPPNHAVQAAFTERSYRAGTNALLSLRGSAARLIVQIFHAGQGADGTLQGAAVSAPQTIVRPSGSIRVTLGDWPSGFYYVRVDTPGRGVWDAPFVLRPRRLGEHPIAIVLPTNTWQAYNNEDGDSWYFDPSVHSIDLARPYIDAGVPPHYHGYDRGFIRWLALNKVRADFFSDDDLDTFASGDLLRPYTLVVFPGHEEYVTEREFDVVQRYRDLGGNLAFLSANDFFYKVTKNGGQMNGRWRWRDLGRPEAALVGAQYVDWNHDTYPNQPYCVTNIASAPWLYRDTDLRVGSRFGVYGIEVDARAPSSPRSTQVLARIPNIFGPGKSAEMTYYTTPKGAKVFSAGVMNFGGSSLWPQVRTLVANLFAYLSAP